MGLLKALANRLADQDGGGSSHSSSHSHDDDDHSHCDDDCTSHVTVNGKKRHKKQSHLSNSEVKDMGEDYSRRVTEARGHLDNMAISCEGDDGCGNINNIQDTLDMIEEYKSDMGCLREELNEKLCDAKKRCTMVSICKLRTRFKRLKESRGEKMREYSMEIEELKSDELTKIQERQIIAMKHLKDDDGDCASTSNACDWSSISQKFCNETKTVNDLFQLFLIDDDDLIHKGDYNNAIIMVDDDNDSSTPDVAKIDESKCSKGDRWMPEEKFWCAAVDHKFSADNTKRLMEILREYTKYRCKIDSEIQEQGWKIMRKITGRCDLGSNVSSKCKKDEEMCFSEWMESNVIRELQNHSAWWKSQTDETTGTTYSSQYGHWNCTDDTFTGGVTIPDPNGAHTVSGQDEYDSSCTVTYAQQGANLDEAVTVWVNSLDEVVDFDSFVCDADKDETDDDWFCSK